MGIWEDQLVGEDPFVEENTSLVRSFGEGKTKLGKGKMNEAMERDFFFRIILGIPKHTYHHSENSLIQEWYHHRSYVIPH